MKRRYLFTLLCILALSTIPQTILAQSAKEQAMKIQRSPDKYYWGDGSGETETTAVEQAVHNLMVTINSKGSAQTVVEMKNIQQGSEVHSETSMKSVFSLNAAGHLKGVHTLLWGRKPEYHVMAYITKEQMKEMSVAFNLPK